MWWLYLQRVNYSSPHGVLLVSIELSVMRRCQAFGQNEQE